MCGIAGIMNINGGKVDLVQQLEQMNEALINRGPDDDGTYVTERIGLTHRRLSILDLSPAGKQPFSCPNGRFYIVFNGEIYNYRELKPDLIEKGYKFKSNTDTEVLLYLYIEYGEAMLSRLNGMFAFAIWDDKEQQLFLGRDRVGVKPLYYTFYKNVFYFASETKAFFSAGIPLNISDEGLNEILLYRYIAGEKTLFNNVKKILPGHYAIINLTGELYIKRWWHLGERILNHAAIKNPSKWFYETLQDSLRYRMISDVPVGVLLSGGYDSSAVAVLLKKLNFEAIHCFNVSFPNYPDDESSIANRLTKDLGFNFWSLDFKDELLVEYLKKSVYAHDEPLIHHNDPQIVGISEFAKPKVSVLLSGEGADEFLGGYVRYNTLLYKKWFPIIYSILKMLPHKFKSKRFSKLERYLSNQSDNILFFNACNYFLEDFKKLGISDFKVDNSFREQTLNEAKIIYPGNAIRQLLYLDQHTYLQSLNDRNDRATMSASIECREPFMDYRLMEGIGTLKNEWLFDGKRNKYLLKESLKKDIPNYILNFRKVGFSVPWRKYILDNPFLCDTLHSMDKSEILNTSIFQYIDKRKLINDFKEGNPENELLTRQLFFIHLWHEIYTIKFKH